MPVRDEILKVFGPDGWLASRLPGFEPRPAQIEMALAVAEAFDEKQRTVIEAATGTGKTVAYLVPAILSGRRTLVSTATKTLQDQLIQKDLPLLRNVVPRPFRAVYLKGRQNYLCIHRYERFEQEPRFRKPEDRHYWPAISRWALSTRSGDRAELTELPDDFPTWADLSANAEQCLGRECPNHQDCFVVKARTAAANADLIVVNHHLFFADLALREGEDMGLLPPYDAVVFDEAHHLEDIASSFFGTHISTWRLSDLVGDIIRTFERDKRDDRALRALGDAARDAVGAFLAAVTRALPPNETRGDWADMAATEHGHAALMALPAAEAALSALTARIEAESALGEAGQKLAVRVTTFANELSMLAERSAPELVYVAETRNRGVFLSAFPIDVSKLFKRTLLRVCATQVFTSATLSTDGGFDFFRARTGLPPETPARTLPATFDYMKQALLFVPPDLPEPNDPLFVEKVAPTLERLLNITEGRAFCLFTSHRNMNRAYQLIAPRIGHRCLLQGEMGRAALLEAFRRDTHSVLFATSSFWEGVDVQGEALSLVVIDKLPFASPSDPLVRARCRVLDNNGGNAFAQYQVPAAVVALKQGFGRLIRHRDDVGIVAILDSRLLTRPYGKRFIKSLPEARRTQDLDLVERWWSSRPANTPPADPAGD
jgi:ATP-dependent DNA helicase DinG